MNYKLLLHFLLWATEGTTENSVQLINCDFINDRSLSTRVIPLFLFKEEDYLCEQPFTKSTSVNKDRQHGKERHVFLINIMEVFKTHI